VFHYTVDDQQLTAVGGATNFNTLINAKEATGQGFEVDLEAWFTDNLFVTVGASYNDTEINDPNLYIAACGGGCTVLDPQGRRQAPVSIDGNSLPKAPKWISNLTARWAMPINDSEFYVFTDWAYRDEVNFFLYESPNSPAIRCSKAACAWATTGTTASTTSRCSAQHHRRSRSGRRHRLQQPDRLRQRAARDRGGVQGHVLRCRTIGSEPGTGGPQRPPPVPPL
jgi:hypothetical protein